MGLIPGQGTKIPHAALCSQEICIYTYIYTKWASQVAKVVKNLPANAGDAGDTGSIPGLERSPGVGNGKTHSSILAWKIPWTEEPGELKSMGSQRARHH